MGAKEDMQEILNKGYLALKFYNIYTAGEIEGIPLEAGQLSQIRTRVANWVARVKVLAAGLPDLE